MPSMEPGQWFDTPEAEALNRARMDHLESLGLDLQGKSVLDVGCGVGKLAPFFLAKNCLVCSIDVREENIVELRRRKVTHRSTQWTAFRLDVESELLPAADVVFCYGLLYHLTDPWRTLRNLAATGAELLLLETIVCDSPLPVLLFDKEDSRVSNQSVCGFGTRPSVGLVAALMVAAGFKHVYRPTTLPDHPDFCWHETGMMLWKEPGRNFRAIFIGSRKPLPIPEVKK